MNKTRIIAVASVLALAGAGQASAGGLTGLGIVGNKTGGIVIAPSVGVGDILSNNNNKNNVLTGILNNSLNGTLSGVLSGANIGILGGSDCGCKTRNH